MSTTIATTEPNSFIAGNTVKWTKSVSDYKPEDSWVLKYYFVKTGTQLTLTATDNGDSKHLITLTAANSADWPAGEYKWQAVVTKTTERYVVDSGSLTVEPDFAQQISGHDSRTYWETVLENVKAVLEERATKDQSSYTIHGRQLSRTPVADLLSLYSKAEGEVEKEKRAEAIKNGLGHSGKILTRF